MKQKFYQGELVTALPNYDYGVTYDGWTGRVISCANSGSHFRVEARCRNGHITDERSWDVLKKFFIPYSSNMETSAFGSFYIYGGDDG